jgi:hypothetical protein
VRFREEEGGRLRAYVIESGEDLSSALRLRIGASGPAFAVDEAGEADLEGIAEPQIRDALVLVEREIGDRHRP